MTLAFRDLTGLIFGIARTYERKVEYTVAEAFDLLNGLSNVRPHTLL